MRMKHGILALIAALLLTACGGGGGGCDAGSSSFGGSTSGCGAATVNTTAANLVLQLDRASVTNSGSDTITATATATTSGGQTVSGVPVSFTVDNNALYTPSGTSTDTAGVVTAKVSIGADRSNRIITITAQSGSLSATASVAVTGAKLTGTPVPAVVAPSSNGNRVDFRLVDANSNPMAGQAIAVTAGAVATANGVTGTNGEYSFTYTAPAASGALDVTAKAGGVTNTQTVQVQAGSAVPPVVTPILSASVAVDPSVVAVNDASTNNRAEVRALFLGASNAPIKNVRVRFDLDGDVNSIGGSFSTGDNIVYSDANGIASTAYIPGSRASPTNGVTIRACYDTVDFPVCNAGKPAAKKTLTVAAEPLSVTIGTNNLIIIGSLTYKQQFVVLVVDSAGRAKGNVDVVPSIDLQYFSKGQYSRVGGSWINQCTDPDPAVCPVVIPPPVACLNEDINRNAVLETGEDVNVNGQLDPRKSDVAISIVGSSKTDSTGIVTVQIEYPKNLGSWIAYKILVSASGISGTEGRASWFDVLGVPITDVKAEGAPAFIRSVYGVVVVPADDPTDSPDRGVVQPCANKN